MRKFESGATRSEETGRVDPEGYLSPLVMERFCKYMGKHRTTEDGGTRKSDNWQKGIPISVYMKGLWRHFMHAWTRHRGWEVRDPGAAEDIQEDLCAIIFNTQGYLHELLAEEERTRNEFPTRAYRSRGDGTFEEVKI